LSSETVVYKGMLKPVQLRVFFPDLQAEDFWSVQNTVVFI